MNEILKHTVVLDTETTSLNFKEAEVIEFGFVLYSDNKWEQYNELHKPSINIEPEISAVTNITNKMVEGRPPFEDCLYKFNTVLDTVGTKDETMIVAHNAFYDKSVLKYGYANANVLDHQWICTMRLAKKLYADDDTVKLFNLTYLRYRFELDVPEDMPAHRASSDAYVTAKLFEHLLTEAESQGVFTEDTNKRQQLISWLDAPVVITKMPFGKHRGKKLEEVPMSYWSWALDNLSSLNEKADEYDEDFATSVALALEKLI